MSRPILSRPRTRVYGCNYEKGESYYKPMVDHLDRKYSSRPLFSEPRGSIADEIAARRSDIGTRSLADSRMDESFDDDYYYDDQERERINAQQRDVDSSSVEEFIMTQRRTKQRALEAFERDLEELRKRRRDMQDKMFDMIDMNAEIERARSTLDGANTAFLRHATKFNNTETPEPEATTVAEKIDRNRKIQAAELGAKTAEVTSRPKLPIFRWTRMQEIEKDPPGLVQGIYNRRARINSIIADDVITDASSNVKTTTDEQQNNVGPKETPLPKERTKKRRSFLKRKKSVSF